jgi:broad specificity phosphatase PhoE
MWRFVILLLLLLSPASAEPLASAGQPGTVLLMRHALAPGTNDPPAFRLGDCSTQRNLSAEGRNQARAIGERLRAARVTPDVVATSQWCRARDTAELLALGPPVEWPEINSFFAGRGDRAAQTEATLARIAALPEEAVALLVTHQVNITALTGIVPQSGEIILTRREGAALRVVGRLSPE